MGKLSFVFIYSSIILSLISACSTHEQFEVAYCEIDQDIIKFNYQIAYLQEGDDKYFAESPFGPATIGAGPLYISGLGNECRSTRVTQRTTSQRLALCKEDSGAWRFIPTIFESMP